MKAYIPPFIAILIGIGYYYFQPSVVIDSSEETGIDDKPLVKKNLESKESGDKPIGAIESPKEKQIDDKPISVIESPEEKQIDDKPVIVIERPEEKRTEDKPIARKSFESIESDDREVYGNPLPRRYSFE